MPFSTRKNESIHPFAISGMVACGGASSRMGVDKSMLEYHGIPQRYFLYDLLKNCCENVFLSLNKTQASAEHSARQVLVDMDEFNGSGPISALMSFRNMYPGVSVMMVGCDYPNVTPGLIIEFLSAILPMNKSAAFASSDGQVYEPLLAFYHSSDLAHLPQQFETGNYSLQFFLNSVNAEKYFTNDLSCLLNINSREEFLHYQLNHSTQQYV